MTLSAQTKKNLHALFVAAAGGALTYLTGALVGTNVPAWRDVLTGMILGAASRVAGVWLAKVETTPTAPAA